MKCVYCLVESCAMCNNMLPNQRGLQCDNCWHADDVEPLRTDEGDSDAVSTSSCGSSTQQEDDSGNEDEVQNDAAEAVSQVMFQRRPAGDDEALIWQHRTLRTLHRQGTDNLACGRPLTLPYVPLGGTPAFDYPRCAICFGRELNPVTVSVEPAEAGDLTSPE